MDLNKKMLKTSYTEKPRLLVWSDPPCYQDQQVFPTGHGKIFRNLVPALDKKFSLLNIGFGVTGQYRFLPYAMNCVNINGAEDYWGFETFKQIMKNAPPEQKPQAVITISDFKSQGRIASDKFLEIIKEHDLPWIIYIAMDDSDLRPEYVPSLLYADKIVGMAEYTEKIITELGKLSFVSKKTSFIYPPIDRTIYSSVDAKERTQLREMFGWSNDDKIVLCIAKNQYRKNLVSLFNMLGYLPERYKLFIISLAVKRDIDSSEIDGWNFDAIIKKWVEPKNKGRITINNGQFLMTQPIKEETLANYYRAADVFVLPSTSEGLGLPFLEAQACACPCVGTTWGPVTELLSETRGLLIDNYDDYPYSISMGRTPFLSARPSVKSMAEKVLRICEDEELRKEIMANGLAFVNELNTKTEKFCDVIEDAIKGHSAKNDKFEPDIIF